MTASKSITEFFGAHQGRPGVVVCSGPSLVDISKEDLNSLISITVNSSIAYYPECHYFVSDDQDLKNWSYFTKDLVQSRCVKFLFGKKLGAEAHRFRPQEVCQFDHTWWYDPSTGRKNTDGIIMRRNTSGKLIGARSSAATAIHILHLMGCSPILLAGMDGSVVAGKRYFWELPGQAKIWRTNGGLQRNPMSLIMGKKELMEINDYWDEFAAANEDCISSIWNCCPHSSVSAFKKMSWNDAIRTVRESAP